MEVKASGNITLWNINFIGHFDTVHRSEEIVNCCKQCCKMFYHVDK